MFCSQCGAQLINGAKFCSNCGAAITSSGSSIQSSGEQITSNITIPVLSGSIILPLNVQESGRLFKEFKDLAVSKAKAHTNAFDSTYADLDAFISKSDSVINGIYLEFYQKALDYLKAQGIFSYNLEQIAQICSASPFMWNEFYGNLYSDYQCMQKKAAQEVAYREQRKQSRGRVVGGGFGAKGAMKGIVAAGAINSLTGAAHAAYNSIGDFATELNLSMEKGLIMKDPAMRTKIETIIIHDCVQIYGKMIELYNSARSDNPLPVYSADNYYSARNIYASIQESGFPSNQRANAVLEMLQTFPFSEDFYQLAVSVFPDEESTFKNLSQKCGIQFHKKLYGKDAERYEIAHQLCQNIFFQEVAGSLKNDNLLEVLTNIVERHRIDLGKRVYVLGDSSIPRHTAALKRIQKGETPYFCIDNTLFGSDGKKGILITDKALYGCDNWPRKELKDLDTCIEKGYFYYERKDLNSKNKYDVSTSINLEDIYGNTSDGTLLNELVHFLVDVLKFIALSPSDENNLSTEIITLDDQDYESFLALHSQSAEISTHIKEIDALLTEILQTSLLEIQKSSDFGRYFIPCGSRCPATRMPQLEGLLKEIGDQKDSSELELIFGAGAGSKKSGIFLLTNKALYTPKVRIELRAIKTLEVKGKLFSSIVVNGIEIDCPYNTNVRNEFCHDLVDKIIPLTEKRLE